MAANTSNMNLDISSYTLNELFDLLGVDVKLDGDILTQEVFDKSSTGKGRAVFTRLGATVNFVAVAAGLVRR